MKQLTQLEQWADSVLLEFDASNVKSTAKKATRSNKADDDAKSNDGRNLSISQDPIRQTQLNNPHLSREEAASKYLYDITADFKRDTQELDREQKQNAELRKRVIDLSNRYGDLVRDNKQTHDELDRLQQLAGTLKTQSQGQLVRSTELEKVLKQVEELRGKPGVSSDEYKNLVKQVEDFKDTGVDREALDQFKQQLAKLSVEREVDRDDYQKLKDIAANVQAGQQELARGQSLRSDEIQTALRQIEELKGKANVSGEEYKSLVKQVEEYKNAGVDRTAFEQFKDQLTNLSNQRSVDRSEFERLRDLAANVEAEQKNIQSARTSVQKQIDDLERRQAEVENREKQHDQEVKDEVEAEVKKVRDKMADYAKRVKARSKTTKQRVDAIAGKNDENLSDLKAVADTKQYVDKLKGFIIPQLRADDYGLQTAIEFGNKHDEFQDRELKALSGGKLDMRKKYRYKGEPSMLYDPIVAPKNFAYMNDPKNFAALKARVAAKKAKYEREFGSDEERDKEWYAKYGRTTELDRPFPWQDTTLNESVHDVNMDQTLSLFNAAPERTREVIKMYTDDVYYDFTNDPNKRGIIRRYTSHAVRFAILLLVFYYITKKKYKIGRTDPNTLWRPLLGVLVKKYPHVEHSDLGNIQTSPFADVSFDRVIEPVVSPYPPGDPRAPKNSNTADSKNDMSVREAKLPREYLDAVNSLAEDILGPQYSKYLK